MSDLTPVVSDVNDSSDKMETNVSKTFSSSVSVFLLFLSQYYCRNEMKAPISETKVDFTVFPLCILKSALF